MCKRIEWDFLKFNPINITPDTNTYAWKQNMYRQDTANKNVCIKLRDRVVGWLCSNDLPSDGEFIFTIKAIKVRKDKYDYGSSYISIGIMDSSRKGKE